MRSVSAVLLLAGLLAGCQSDAPTTGSRSQGGLDEHENWVTLLCFSYRTGHIGTITARNLRAFQAESENGSLDCQIALGRLYEDGIGVPQDLAKARDIYQSAARADSTAYIELGRLAEEGIGEPVDYAKARQLYLRAGAQDGNQIAALRLARLLENGKGGPQDLDTALSLYTGNLKNSQGEAWEGAQRLRSLGVRFDSQQALRYNQAWLYGMRGALNRVISKAEEDVRSTQASKPIRVQIDFSNEASAPELTLLESSGDTAADAAVLTIIGSLRSPGEPILSAQQKRWRVQSSIRLKAQ
jgi:hypothetical protein